MGGQSGGRETSEDPQAIVQARGDGDLEGAAGIRFWRCLNIEL